jgi:glycogen synthase
MINVLMLGWEFPPLFSGGLGIATFGIVKALSPKTKIRLIIPTAAALTELQNVSIIGLNRVTAREINLERVQFNFAFPNTEVYPIPLSLSPYHHANAAIESGATEYEDLLKTDKIVDIIHRIFVGNEVYGSNIMHKVQLFSRLAGEIAADGKFDIIHAHDWVTYAAGVEIKKKSGKPLVLHVHSLETDRAGHSARNEIYSLERTAMETADRIIAVSQYTKDQIVRHYEISPLKIIVVHNGIDAAKKKHKKHRLKDKIVVFLGRLTHQKGPQFLLETAEKVSRVYPRVKFVVAGTGDQFIPLLESSAFQKLGNKFIFTGFLSKAKVDELLSVADVYFMPSVSEPFGLSALEAAQFGVPGVISSQSGAAEVLKAALRADFWDTDKFANYIFALLMYHALRKEISEKSKEDLSQLTWKHASQKIIEVYHSLLNN